MLTKTTARTAVDDELRRLAIPPAWAGIRPLNLVGWVALAGATAVAGYAFTRGDLETEIIAVAAGIWALTLGRWLGHDRAKNGGVFAATAAALTLAAALLARPGLAWTVALVSVVVAVAGMFELRRRRRVARSLVWLAVGLAQKTSDARPVTEILTPRWWRARRSGLPVSWTYPHGLTPDEKQLDALEAVATSRTGVKTAITFMPVRALIAERPVLPEVEVETPDPEVARLQAPLAKMAPGLRVTSLEYDEDGKFAGLELDWTPEANVRMTSLPFRDRVMRILHQTIKASTDGDPNAPKPMIRPIWDVANDRARVVPVPALPNAIPHPPRDPNPKNPWKNAFGQFRDGSLCVWDMNATLPHILIVGGTGGGKTTLMLTLATSTPLTAEIQPMLFAIDPKRVGLRNFHLLPGAQRKAATRPPEFVDVIQQVHDIMDKRLDDVVDEVLDRDSLQPLVLMCDEGEEMALLLNEWWKAGGGKEDWIARMAAAGTPITGKPSGQVHPAMTMLGSILRLGREVRVHVIIASQSALAEWLPTSARGQLAIRIALRNLSTSDSNVIFGTTGAAAGLEPEAGRAWVQVGMGAPLGQAQIFWTPSIKKGLPEADREILRGRGVTPPDEVPDDGSALEATLPSTAVAVLERPEDEFTVPDTVAELLAEDGAPATAPGGSTRSETTPEPAPVLPAVVDDVYDDDDEGGEEESGPDALPPTVPGAVVDLADGDRFLVDTDYGTQAVATVLDVEPDDLDPDCLAVTYELDSGEQGVVSLRDDESVLVVQ
jgi:FtsK/SpoIIIE family